MGKRNALERLTSFTYSYEENTTPINWYDVPEVEKHPRSAEIMELQAQISWELNQEKVGRPIAVSSIEKKELFCGSHSNGLSRCRQ